MPDSLRNETLEQALRSIGAKTSTPGGGAIAALLHALGTAAAQMTLNFSMGKKKLTEHESLHNETKHKLDELAQHALDWIDADAEAFAQLNELWKLPKDDPKRRAQFQDAVAAAVAPPQAVLAGSVELLRLLKRLCGATNAMLNSDFAIAAIAAEAAARSAAWNVRVNIPLLDDAEQAAALGREMQAHLDEAAELHEHVTRQCQQVAGAS